MTDYTGIVPTLDEQLYHAHHALSSTQARRLLDSPAKFKWAQTHPQAPKAEFDLGHAVHEKVLGVGGGITVIPDDVLASNGAVSTKAAKDFIEAARADGLVPIKRDVADVVDAMAEAVLAHPLARFLLEQPGHPEASVFATDPDTEVPLRARFDFLPSPEAKRLIGIDLKTSRDASRVGFARAAAEHRYDVQRGHYLDTLEYAGRELEGFSFVVVENVAPYLVAVRPLAEKFEEIGVADARKARRIYRQCLDADEWPGYSLDFEDVMPPFWLIADFEETANV